MSNRPSNWTQMVYYGEVVGVVLAWAVGVLVVLGADPPQTPSVDAQRVATAASQGAD